MSPPLVKPKWLYKLGKGVVLGQGEGISRYLIIILTLLINHWLHWLILGLVLAGNKDIIG